MGPGGAGGKEAAAKYVSTNLSFFLLVVGIFRLFFLTFLNEIDLSRQQAAEDQRNMMLAQILSASARERRTSPLTFPI